MDNDNDDDDDDDDGNFFNFFSVFLKLSQIFLNFQTSAAEY